MIRRKTIKVSNREINIMLETAIEKMEAQDKKIAELKDEKSKMFAEVNRQELEIRDLRARLQEQTDE